MKNKQTISASRMRYALRRKLHSHRTMTKADNNTNNHTTPESTQSPNSRDSNTQELTLLRETIIRQRSEFDNFRKRTQREKDMIREVAAETLLAKLLPSMDNMERALSSAKTAVDVKSVREGVSMILIQFQRTLEAEGLKQVDALHKPFDPTLHDALATEIRSDVPDNHVSEVMLPGYVYKEKLLRPAMVKVAKSTIGEKITSVD